MAGRAGDDGAGGATVAVVAGVAVCACAVKLRLRAFLDTLRGTSARHIAVVSHAEPIQLMLGMLSGVSDSEAKQRPISHCFPISVDL